MTIINSLLMQFTSNSLSRVFGIAIAGLMYRIFDIHEMAEYFLVLSIFSIFLTIQQFGSQKVLIKEYAAGNITAVAGIIKSRLYISTILAFVFFVAILNTNYDIDTYSIAALSLAIALSNLTFDFILISKRNFKYLSLLQIFSNALTLILFAGFYIANLKPFVATHQLILTFSLFVLINVFALKTSGLSINAAHFTESKRVSSHFFIRNAVLIFTQTLLPILSTYDYLLAEKFLNADDFGIIAGLFRYSLISYGFLMTANSVFYSFSVNLERHENFEKQKKKIYFWYSIFSLSGFSVLLHPYLHFIMNMDAGIPTYVAGTMIVFGVALMPFFFNELNIVEKNFESVPFLLMLVLTALVFGAIALFVFVLQQIAPVPLQLSVVSFAFLLKWYLFWLILKHVNRKYCP